MSGHPTRSLASLLIGVTLACTDGGSAPAPTAAQAPAEPAASTPTSGPLSLPPPPAPAPGPIAQVAAGVHHSCAIKGGRVYCWGLNRSGMLGVGPELPKLVPQPHEVEGFGDDPVVTLELDYDFSCALTAGGDVYCWGDNGSGQLGTGDEERRISPTRVVGPSNVRELDLSFERVCARGVHDRQPWCWGKGEFGDGPSRREARPVEIASLAVATDIDHDCMLRASQIYCWGDSSGGQLGNGEGGCEYDEPLPEHGRRLPSRTCKRSDTPVAAIGLPHIVELDASGHYVYARDADGGVWQWGQVGTTMSYGPLPSYRPQRREDLPPVVEVSAGSSHACARTEAGELWCWGNNSFGQLGVAPARNDNELEPRALAGLPPVRAIAAGFYLTCVLAGPEGAAEIWCWGDNSDGQLGDGTTERRHEPAPIVW